VSDETDKAEEGAGGPVGGERLRQARRANDISVRDVAKELHIDEHKVRALEKNDFSVLGAPVFAKGHLRKYAELVGVSIDDVMTDYYQMNRSVGAPPIVGPKRAVQREFNSLPWIIAILFAVVLGGAAWWWFSKETPEPVARVAPPVPVARSSGDRATEPATQPRAGESAEAGADAAPTAAATQAPPTDTTDSDVAEEVADPAGADATYRPTPGAPQVSVTLAYGGDCWTEVTDASGNRLFYSLGQEGRSVTVSGDAPLRIILGDADAVDVTVEGRHWPIPASARRGQLARLTIPAP